MFVERYQFIEAFTIRKMEACNDKVVWVFEQCGTIII